MGPNVKFVSPICDLIFERKNRGNFFIRKKTIPGGGRGGVRWGVWQKTIRNTDFFSGTLPLFPLMPICQPPIRKEEEEGESVLGDIAFFYENNENTLTTSTFCFWSGNNILPQTRLPLLLLAETNKRRNTTGPTRLFFENRFRRLFPTM